MNFRSLGFIIGIIVGIILVIVLLQAINRDGKLNTKYDERQLRVRGDAYKFGFFATVLANALLLVFSTTEYGVGIFGYTVFFIPIFVGIIVQISYSIFKDGYVGLNTNMPRFMISMAFISAFNFFIAIMAMVRGGFIEDGVLQAPFLNLLCGILFIVLAAEIGIKMIMDQKGE